MNDAQAQANRQLLSDTREGLKKGVEFLYREERPKIFKELANYCTLAEQEELFDDALMVLLKKVAFIKKNPVAYFWQICRNKAYDLYQLNKKNKLVLAEEDQLIQLQDQAIKLEAPDFKINGDQAFLYAIHSLMDKLGKEDREVLMHRYFQNWSNQDIAEEVGIAKQSVANKLYRILKKLRELLDKEPWIKEILEEQLYEAF